MMVNTCWYWEPKWLNMECPKKDVPITTVRGYPSKNHSSSLLYQFPIRYPLPSKKSPRKPRVSWWNSQCTIRILTWQTVSLYMVAFFNIAKVQQRLKINDRISQSEASITKIHQKSNKHSSRYRFYVELLALQHLSYLHPYFWPHNMYAIEPGPRGLVVFDHIPLFLFILFHVFWVPFPETNSSPLKMDGWNTFSFPFGMAYFQVRLKGSIRYQLGVEPQSSECCVELQNSEVSRKIDVNIMKKQHFCDQKRFKT